MTYANKSTFLKKKRLTVQNVSGGVLLSGNRITRKRKKTYYT